VISRYFFKRVAYICPECHTVFRPSLKEAFFARHTRTLRKVTCTHCGHKGFCVETYGEGAEQ
jgi:DNA-directed RNA polymerase subunit RPC12/RpoP